MPATRAPMDRSETLAETAAAAHVVKVARALEDMDGIATALSTTQQVGPDEADAIERLLPILAARYRLRATSERDGRSLRVRFERSEPDARR